ncbi:outer membrane protein assembly factor BamE [Leptospira noguchii]|uniref:outer membrane protein assembly factor BamE n=1 Tax=Leptospira noguchii TaxID=28182 RepID=UPI001FB7F3B9|nr:outer membrane protein assembly factor BamE [Leptospira noguchii]UOG35489.1 outer membrane protein assembly factor BamE [Leptospira noguchii]UOG46409.1 outer membrane protein assembly factor BamE [Leptospira noguchii]
MSEFIGILLFASIIVTFLRLIKPSLVIRWNAEKNRKTVFKYFGVLAITFIVAYALTKEDGTSSSSNTESEKGSITKENCQAVKNGMSKEEVTALLGF